MCVSLGFFWEGTCVHMGRLGGDSPGKDLINVLLVCFIASVFTLGYGSIDLSLRLSLSLPRGRGGSAGARALCPVFVSNFGFTLRGRLSVFGLRLSLAASCVCGVV